MLMAWCMFNYNVVSAGMESYIRYNGHNWESGFGELRINKSCFKTPVDMLKGSGLYISNKKCSLPCSLL